MVDVKELRNTVDSVRILMAEGKDRPLLISIIAILYFISGILCILSGIVLALGMISVDTNLAVSSAVFGGVAVIMGLILLVIAGGFWNGWRIMWYLGVIFTGIGIIVSIMALISMQLGAVISLVIYLLIMYYLFRPKVKEFFGI